MKISCTEPECDKYFFKKVSMKKHMKRIHKIKDANEKFHCKVCGNEYGKKAALRRHKRRIHGILKKQNLGETVKPQVFNCTNCENTYSSRDKLARHEIQHTAPDGKPFDCLICDTLFSRKDALTRHRKRKNH